MITYKPIIIPGGRRRDGTWPVKIRITFKGVTRRLPTTLVCTDADLTRSGRIKNATVLEKAGELIARMRATTADLSPFTLAAWDVDKVVEHIRGSLTAQSFQLDFLTFGREFIEAKGEGTRKGYATALNAFARYLNRSTVDINEITRPMLMDFQSWADTQGRVFFNYRTGQYQPTGKETARGGNAGRWTQRLAHIFQAAKDRYNDEDAGRILIPRSPFDKLPRPKVVNHGQTALPVEVIQRMIDARPEAYLERVALAAFLVSFGTMGANLADLWKATPPRGGKWRYFRSKTTDKRRDRAEVFVRLEPEIETFVGILQTEPGTGLWLPGFSDNSRTKSARKEAPDRSPEPHPFTVHYDTVYGGKGMHYSRLFKMPSSCATS